MSQPIPNAKALFAECRRLAPDFKVRVEYTTAQLTGRVLKWYATKNGTPMSLGYDFPEGRDFEPIYSVLLQNAVIALR